MTDAPDTVVLPKIGDTRVENGRAWRLYEVELEGEKWEDVGPVPTEGVTASGDNLRAVVKDVAERVAKNAEVAPQMCYAPVLFALQDAIDAGRLAVENSTSSALGGYEPKANAQEPLSGSQALPSASTTNIRALPGTAGEVEPVAWRGTANGIDDVTQRSDTMADWVRYGRAIEPLYSQATVSTLRAEIERLRTASIVARDLATRPMADGAIDGPFARLKRIGSLLGQALGGSHE